MDKNVVKIVVTFEPIMQFWCPSRFRILRTISSLSILWRKARNMTLCPLSTITAFVTDKKTNRRTWRLYDQPGTQGRVEENRVCTSVYQWIPVYTNEYQWKPVYSSLHQFILVIQCKTKMFLVHINQNIPCNKSLTKKSILASTFLSVLSYHVY